MAWFAVVERATGRLESVGTVLAEQLPPHLEAIELPSAPGDNMWDEASRTFVPRPPKVIIDLLESPLFTTLTPPQRALLNRIAEEGRYVRG
jgi:hypothetical protein